MTYPISVYIYSFLAVFFLILAIVLAVRKRNSTNQLTTTYQPRVVMAPQPQIVVTQPPTPVYFSPGVAPVYSASSPVQPHVYTSGYPASGYTGGYSPNSYGQNPSQPRY